MLVWVIDPGHPGELNQCLGVAKALTRHAAGRTEVIKLKLRNKRLRSAFTAALYLNAFSGSRHRWLVTMLYRLLFAGPQLDGAKPDVTVSTLGRGEMPALFLRQFLGSRAIHIGAPTRTSSKNFDLIIRMPTQNMDVLDAPTVTLDIAPTPILLDDADFTSPLIERWRRQASRLCAVLIGGDGSGYKYRPDEWRTLADELARLASEQNIGIILTTSRRTGPVAENAFRTNAALGQSLVHAGWYGQASPGTIRDFLAAADFVICTEESRSMISDAIAAGKLVYTVSPSHAHPREARLLELLASQESAKRIKRIRLDQISRLDVDTDENGQFSPRSECWSAAVLREIEQSLPELAALLSVEQTTGRHDVARTSRE
jgi:uncharacterized protein